MLTLVAISAAVGTAWFVNGLIRSSMGNRGIVFLTPLVEEAAKTLGAIGLGVPLFWTHVGFGIAEGLLEIKRRGSRGIVAGWSALAAHSFFGWLTAWVYLHKGLLTAILFAYFIHVLWNMLIVYGQELVRLTKNK